MSERHSERSGPPRRPPDAPVYRPGQRVADLEDGRAGEVLDVARQYSHPNADPVHNYLVRWDDGIVEALNERAFSALWGIEVEES